MLLHSRKTRFEWALGEELGRNRNIFLVVVVKRQKWGCSLPTGNRGSQLPVITVLLLSYYSVISCGIRKKSGVFRREKWKSKTRK